MFNILFIILTILSNLGIRNSEDVQNQMSKIKDFLFNNLKVSYVCIIYIYFLINFFEIIGKLLVTSGYPINQGVHTEIIDLINPNIKCEKFQDLPIELDLAFGGLLENRPIICGGHSNLTYETKCYEIGTNEIIAELNQPRCCGASMILNEETLWISGGSTKGTKQTTEFIRLDQPTVPGRYIFLINH